MPTKLSTRRNQVKDQNRLADKIVDSFEGNIPPIQRSLFKKIVRQIKDLTLDKQGKVKPTSANLKIVSRLTVDDLKEDMVNKYEDSVESLNKGLDSLATKADKMYGVK